VGEPGLPPVPLYLYTFGEFDHLIYWLFCGATLLCGDGWPINNGGMTMNVKMEQLRGLLNLKADGVKMNRRNRRAVAKLERELRINRPTLVVRRLPEASGLTVVA